MNIKNINTYWRNKSHQMTEGESHSIQHKRKLPQ